MCNESVSDLVAEMERQQARIRGVAHCIIPQEFTIKKPTPMIPLPPLQKLLPVVVGQSPGVQLSGAPAVVQVLVPSNQILPNQIPVLVSSNIQTTATPPPPMAEATTLLTTAEVKTTTTPPTTTTTTPRTVVEITTTLAQILNIPTEAIVVTTPPESLEPAPLQPEEIPLEANSPFVELKAPSEAGRLPNILHPAAAISFRMHYSADPPADEELGNGISEVPKQAPVLLPEVIVPPIADSSMRKLVMQPEDDPPEMLHDQEMPAGTLSIEIEV